MPDDLDRFGSFARRSIAMLRDPSAGLVRIGGRLDRRQDRRAFRRLGVSGTDLYHPTDDWHGALHELIGAPWPCAVDAHFGRIWSDVVETVSGQGLSFGRASYGGWDDADVRFAHAAWCIAAHMRPRRVVETGVARGVTTRIILEALATAGEGHLWSIDLPHLDSRIASETGLAVPQELRGYWTYIAGPTTRHLPRLMASLGEIDLFVHDSLHTGRNVRFELEHAWQNLREGGVTLVDDVDHSLAFHTFVRSLARTNGSQLTAAAADGRSIWGVLVRT
jgi:methyltransferase family protein